MIWVVIEEKSFEADISELIDTHPRIYDAIEAASWVLAREPLKSKAIDGFPTFRVFETERRAGVPAYRILYEVDGRNHKVSFLGIGPV